MSASNTNNNSSRNRHQVVKHLNSMPAILTSMQLKNLQDHKYSSHGTSLLDPLFQKYWNWIVLKVPTYVAPNLITIIGLAINIFTSILMIVSAPNADTCAPSWILILCALGLFIYQTLDAIDGKQARRTKSSSPLGELFDHGCDALSTVFVVLSSCIALRMASIDSWLMFLVCFVGMAAFYVAHWRTYVTGSLSFGKMDCTEAQCSIYTIFLISALFGDSFWSLKVPILNIDFRYVPCIVSIVGPVTTVLTHLHTILRGGCGRNGSTVANTSILFPLFPLTLVLFLSVIIARKSSEGLYEQNICLYILAFGFVWSKSTILLIVAHMTKGEIYLTDSCLIGPVVLLLNQYFNNLFPEYYVLWFCLDLALSKPVYK